MSGEKKNKAKSLPIDASSELSRVVQELPRVAKRCQELSRVAQSCSELREKNRVTDGPTDGRTDRRTDGPTDTPSYRDARTHLKTYFVMTGNLEIWQVRFLSPFFCSCIISCHCIDFCGSQALKGTKNCNFAVFYSIKTDFLMFGRLEIWKVHFLSPLICP